MNYFLIVCIIIFFYVFYENKFYKIKRVKLKTNKVSEKVKFIQITDYHLNKLINLEKLKADIDKINPKFILLTGDIINRNSNENNLKSLEEFLKIFNKDVYFVTGNHEYENKNYCLFKEMFEEFQVKTFDGNFYELDSNVRIYGNNYKDDYKILNLDENKYNILLIHNPLKFIYGDFPKFDLTLSGHIHGGQVRIPKIGAIIDHDKKLFPKFSKGIYKRGNGNLYISSGLGSKFFLRIYNPVEIVEFEVGDSGGNYEKTN